MHVLRILDASLNRAAEGLRVAEDYVRFVLDDPFLTSQLKSLRHDFAGLARTIPSIDRHAARDTQQDVGTAIATDSESTRADAWDVCAASLKRTQQSLRSIEEYGKLLDVSLSRQAESLRYHLYTLEKAIDINRDGRDRLDTLTLCVLLGGCETQEQFEHLVSDLVAAQVGMIQLRDKSLDDRELIARAKSLVALTRPASRGVPAPELCINIEERSTSSNTSPPQPHTLAIINDRPDIAALARADGVHVGQEDLTVKDARRIVGPRALIGVSTHNIDQARAAVLDGANYLGAGPTFPSSTKKFDAFAGLDYLRQVAAEIRLPTFAIGGITAKNLPDVLAAGIRRVAVSSAITAAEKPPCAAHELLDMLNNPKRLSAEATMPSISPVPSP